MRIQLIFYNANNTHHDKRNYVGRYALETMILSILEEFYGADIKERVSKILTDKLTEG